MASAAVDLSVSDSDSDNSDDSDDSDDFPSFPKLSEEEKIQREQRYLESLKKEREANRCAKIEKALRTSIASLLFLDHYGDVEISDNGWTITCTAHVDAKRFKRFLIETAGPSSLLPQRFVDALMKRTDIDWAQAVRKHEHAKLSARRSKAAERGWETRRINQECIEEEFQRHLDKARERKEAERRTQEFIRSGGMAALMQKERDEREAEALRSRRAEAEYNRRRLQAAQPTKRKQTQPSTSAATNRSDALEWLRCKARKARQYFKSKNIKVIRKGHTVEQSLLDKGGSASIVKAGRQVDTAIQGLLNPEAKKLCQEFLQQNETAGMKRARQEYKEIQNIKEQVQVVGLYYRHAQKEHRIAKLKQIYSLVC